MSEQERTTKQTIVPASNEQPELTVPGILRKRTKEPVVPPSPKKPRTLATFSDPMSRTVQITPTHTQSAGGDLPSYKQLLDRISSQLEGLTLSNSQQAQRH